MPFAEDQDVIQALPAKRSREPLGKCIRARRPDRRLDHPRAVPGEDLIKGHSELAVRSRITNLNRPARSPRSMCSPGTRHPLGMGRRCRGRRMSRSAASPAAPPAGAPGPPSTRACRPPRTWPYAAGHAAGRVGVHQRRAVHPATRYPARARSACSASSTQRSQTAGRRCLSPPGQRSGCISVARAGRVGQAGGCGRR